MKSVLVISEGDQEKGTTAAGSSGFMWVGTGHTVWTVAGQEVRRQIPTRTPGIYSKLFLRITANSTNGNVILRSRKNGANGNISITIPAGFTGPITDAINSDAVIAGDLYCLQYVATGTTGTLTFSIISLVFDATTNCVSRMIAEGYSLVNPSITHFLPTSGDRSGVTTSEAAAQNQVKKPGIAKNLFMFIPTNVRTTNTTYTLRKNGADTGLTVTVGPGVVNAIEDTTHSISVAANDRLCWGITSGAGTETLAFAFICFEYETTTEHFWISAGCVGATSDLVVSANVIHYMTIGGGLTSYVSEADTKLKLRERYTLSDLLIYVPINTVTAASTYRTRINGANGNQTITIPASGVGYFPSVGSDIVNADDDVNLQLVTGATGTSMTIRQAAIWGAIAPIPVTPELIPQVEYGVGRTRKVRLRPQLTREQLAEPPTPKKFKITKEAAGLVTIQFQIERLLLDQIPSIIFNPKIGKTPRPPKKTIIIRETFATPKKLPVVFERLLLSQENSIKFEFEAALLANASPAQLKRVHDKMLGDFTANEQDRRRKQRLRRFRRLLRLLPF